MENSRGRILIMDKLCPIALMLILPAVAVLAAACTNNAPTPPPPLFPTVGTFADPFAYCGAVGTVDKPDTRYTGQPIPDGIINGFKKAAGLESSTEPMDMLRKTTIWRCMEGKVYACNFGANLPCDSKANTDGSPSQAMQDFCKASPNAGSIPMAVTGHDTIYSWHCVNDRAQVLQKSFKVDAAGFIAEIWYPIAPMP